MGHGNGKESHGKTKRERERMMKMTAQPDVGKKKRQTEEKLKEGGLDPWTT